MYATHLEENLNHGLFIVIFKSLGALNWEIFSLFYFLWGSFEAAMSKLSFRARALDANKSLPVYHEEDVPDLPDIASVNRVVPQMPTGMEKEEESEHHLQRAISAQQIYGGSQRLIIPTPDAILYDSDYKQLKRKNVHMPKQLIHVQAFTLEDELPDYDADEEDEKWLQGFNKKNPDKTVDVLTFERIVDTLEKSCSSRIELFTLSDAQALIKKDEKIVKTFFEYWKEKRTKKGLPLAPTVSNEKKDGTAMHDPYVAFRRRVEKMQTRKNRKNDESSYEKMLKLRRDLNRACLILEMVKHREERKRDLLQTTIKILESRYASKDFNNELLHQCYEMLKQRQMQQHDNKPLQTANNNTIREHHTETKTLKRSELLEEQKKRHKLLKQQQRAALLASASEDHSVDTNQTQATSHSREIDKGNEGPDGKYTFRRKKDVVYHAPRYDSMGNWPWMHPVEGGTGASQFAFSKTSMTKQCKCIGFSRRRVGRGGRINFDRAYTPYDEYSTMNDESLVHIDNDRVPPWPHYKPQKRESSDDECENGKTYFNSFDWFKKPDTNNETADTRKHSHKSFTSSPTSRFRVYPYSYNRTRNFKMRKSRSSLSNMNTRLLNSSLVSPLSKTTVDSHNWILRRSSSSSSNTNHLRITNNKKFPISNSRKNHLSPSRPASTAPASAIYQLNFPISTKTPTPTTPSMTNVKTESSLKNINLINNNTILKAVVKSSAGASLLQSSLNTFVDNSGTRLIPSASFASSVSAALLQNSISRQPLTAVQQKSLLAASQQKIIPQSTVSATTSAGGGTILQVQPVMNNVRTNKINNLPKGLTINHTTAVVVSNGITTQPQSIQQLAR